MFAPLLFVAAVFQAPSLAGSVRAGLRLDVLLALILLAWLTISALWSPAELSLTTGSLSGGDFSVDAPQIRFGFTIIAAALLIVGALQWDPKTPSRLPVLMAGAGLFLLLGLLVITPLRETIVEGHGAGILPSAQSAGRAVNLLALSLPLAMAVLVGRLEGRVLYLSLGLILFGFLGVTVWMDGAAALIGLVVGFGILIGLRAMPKRGWVRLFDAIALTTLATPALVWGAISALSGIASSFPTSAHQRLFIWEATVRRVFEKPILGHGADASTTWHRTFAEEPDWLALMPANYELVRIVPGHPHNMPLQVWVETGMIGALLLAGALAMFGRRLPTPDQFDKGALLAAAGVAGVAVTLFFVSYSAWDESFWASLAIVSAAIICLNKLGQSTA
ncbi:MAG: O-antigen ligase family protein [Pseudomonadota bacterium]